MNKQLLNTTIPSVEALWGNWMEGLAPEVSQRDGIKAQFGAAAAVIHYLSTQRAGMGWTFEPTEVRSWEDGLGIDGYLCSSNGDAYAVDFSLEGELNPKGNKRNSEWLVHLSRDWFTVGADGIWRVRKECLGSLLVSFKRCLSAGPVAWSTGTTCGAASGRRH